MTNQDEDRKLANDGSGGAAEHPTLLHRMLDDLVQVVRLDLELLEAKLGQSLMAMAERIIAGFAILALGIVGGCCLVTALILFLHLWLALWLCFTLGGLAVIAGAMIIWSRI